MDANLKIEYLPVTALKPYERNARKHRDMDVDAIVKSIEEFGFDDPIGIWSADNLIVEGHGRLMAAKKLGMKTVPCIRLDHLTDEQRRAYALAHNKTAENSEWDWDVLPDELKSILDIDMTAFGFDFDEDDLIEDDDEDDKNLTKNLPESRMFVFSISAFGTSSECFIEAKIEQDEADRLLERLQVIQPSDIAEKIREVINAL